mmetsp:Transcript_6117/g.14742  ORF Transcript_6117/g.14742 Transcript_6117/m.14742 type:complete len:424 (+) Transcript_6117:528-1799(+)
MYHTLLTALVLLSPHHDPMYRRRMHLAPGRLWCASGATLTLNGRSVTVIGAHKDVPGERDPAEALRLRRFECHSLDFNPERCGVFFGKPMDVTQGLRNALKRSVIHTREFPMEEQQSPEGSYLGPPPDGPDGVSARDAAMATGHKPHVDMVVGEETRSPRHHDDRNSYQQYQHRHHEDQHLQHPDSAGIRNANYPDTGHYSGQDSSPNASGGNGGISFVLDELFGGAGIGATDKAKQLKLLILGGARIHGGSIKVIRGQNDKKQVIHVGLTSEILLRLIELAERGMDMKEALSLITQSIAETNAAVIAERERSQNLQEQASPHDSQANVLHREERNQNQPPQANGLAGEEQGQSQPHEDQQSEQNHQHDSSRQRNLQHQLGESNNQFQDRNHHRVDGNQQLQDPPHPHPLQQQQERPQNPPIP